MGFLSSVYVLILLLLLLFFLLMNTTDVSPDEHEGSGCIPGAFCTLPYLILVRPQKGATLTHLTDEANVLKERC